MMGGYVQFRISVQALVRQEGAWFYASSPLLDVASQGHTQAEALHNLAEAIQALLETCYERGTLDEVLRQRGFRPGEPAEEASEGAEWLNVPVSLIAANNAEARAH